MRDERERARRRGQIAEALAARWLERRGLVVLARNARAGGGELDIVARDGTTIVFVEVRARRSGARFSPAATVDLPKRRRLLRAARGWLAATGSSGAAARIDIVAVTFDGSRCGIEHWPGAVVDDGED